jgi:hypothetical protein
MKTYLIFALDYETEADATKIDADSPAAAAQIWADQQPRPPQHAEWWDGGIKAQITDGEHTWHARITVAYPVGQVDLLP